MFRSYFMTFTGTYRGGDHEGHEDKERLEDPHSMAAHAQAGAITAGAPDAAAHVAATDTAHQTDHSHGAQPAVSHGHDAHGADAGHGHGAADAHGAGHDDHGHHSGPPHESPWSMTGVLAILAGAAVLAGFVFGLPAAWTGHEPVLERWLAPSLPAAEHVPFEELSHSTELLFQFIGGIVIAGGGFLAAYVLYNGNKSTAPAKLKAAFPRAWSLVFNKYYVDEIYKATIIKGTLLIDQIFYWIDQNVIDGAVNLMAVLGKSVAYVDSAIDKYLVDGAVNGVAKLTWNSGKAMRRLQTGHITSYLYGALGGAIAFVIIQYVIR